VSDVGTSPVRVAPLDDEQLLGVVQDAFRQLIGPELERLGAEEFVVSQVRSCMSIVGFVRKGLHERQVGRSRADAELDALLARFAIPEPAGPIGLAELLDPDSDVDDACRRQLTDLLHRRLELDIRTRTEGAGR
jgi:hypothetical protein